jgi:hypothetical protein
MVAQRAFGIANFENENALLFRGMTILIRQQDHSFPSGINTRIP